MKILITPPAARREDMASRITVQNMIDLGVDCITTNEPLLVRKMLGKRELK